MPRSPSSICVSRRSARCFGAQSFWRLHQLDQNPASPLGRAFTWFWVNEAYVVPRCTFADAARGEANALRLKPLHRGAKVIPNPRADRELEAGDRLLCFGKLELMKGLIPAKTRRRRRPKVKELPELPVAHEVLEEDPPQESAGGASPVT